ncbi:MAG: hypothetical protein KF819_15430 [Labilithrix sp.]|nr:hypothetical protein [Labilithrix sp.]
MDRLINTAWRAFWVGLGASAVLITQSLLATAPPPPPVEADPAPPPAVEPAVRAKSADPILSRNPFDSRGPRVARPAS